MSRKQDEQGKARWLAVQSSLDEGETDEGRMNTNLSLLNAGLHRVKGEKGLWAYFPDVPVYPSNSPVQRDLESEWEAKAIQMHSEQTPLTIVDKPIGAPAGEGGFMFGRVVADETPAGIPNFHETPGSTEVQRRTARTVAPAARMRRGD